MVQVYDFTNRQDVWINKEYIVKIDDEGWDKILITLKDGSWVRTYKQYLDKLIR